MTLISLISAAVFVSSLFYIPVGYTSVHFTFVGLAGILLGPFSFLAVSIAVFLQWLLLQHGGITTLGINAFTMGSAALAAAYIFKLRALLPKGSRYNVGCALAAGMAAAFLKVLVGSLFLIAGGYPVQTLYLLLAAHIPVIAGEGIVAGFAAAYLLKFSVYRRSRDMERRVGSLHEKAG